MSVYSTSVGWIREKRRRRDRESCYHTRCCCYHYVVISSCNRTSLSRTSPETTVIPTAQASVSECSTSRIVCDVASTAVFCSEFIIIIIIIIIISAQNRKCAAVTVYGQFPVVLL